MKKTAKYLSALAVAAAGLSTPAALAQDINFYGGVGATYSFIDIDGLFEDSQPGGSLYTGFESRISPSSNVSLGMELSLDYLNTFEDGGVDLDIWGGTLVAKLYAPLTRRGTVRLSGQVGVMYYDVEAKAGGVSASSTEADAIVGIGGDALLGPGFRMGLDYRYMLENDVDLHMIGLRGLYYF